MADLAAGGDGLGAAPQPRRQPFSALVGATAAAFAGEGDRLILWLPVFFGAGIALYFGIM